MEKEDKRGIFFGVIGVLTLIVAIIGASFAYFSINANSRKDALTVNAASVKIKYLEGDQIAINNLIPSTQEIALETQRRALNGEKYTGDDGQQHDYLPCKDDKNYTVCGVYDFELQNNGENPVDIKAYVIPTALQEAVKDEQNPENNKDAEIGFTNLKFIMFDRTNADDKSNGTTLYTGTVNYNESGFGLLDTDIAKTTNIAGNGTTKKYRLFFWLDEKGEANNAEQGATFKGTVHIDLAGAENGNITGRADTLS